MAFAIYVRNANAGEDEGARSLDGQLGALRALARRESVAVGREYVESGRCGLTGGRPEFERLVADARGGAFDGVLVTSADRLCRSASDVGRVLGPLAEGRLGFVLTPEGKYGPDLGAGLAAILPPPSDLRFGRRAARGPAFRSEATLKGNPDAGR